MATVLEARGLGKTYTTVPEPVVALRDFDIAVDEGTLIVVKGRSGSGKTTLLNLLGGLDTPTTGSVTVDGVDLAGLTAAQLAEMRRTTVGFVFQTFGLLPILTASENVEVPMRLARAPYDHRRERSTQLLDHVGLGARARHRPHELSGGEQQRVAIARALANAPRILLADEPTGQLDHRTGRVIVELIHRVVREEGVAAIVATHDPMPMSVADHVIELVDGQAV